MQIIALQQYTDKFVSLYQGQIRNIPDPLALPLIEKGVIAEHTDSGSGIAEDNIFVVTAKLIEQEPYGQMKYTITNVSYTFEQILDAQNQGKTVLLKAEICDNGTSSGRAHVLAYCRTPSLYAEYINSFGFSAFDINFRGNILYYYSISINKDLDNNITALKYTLSQAS